MGSLTNIRARAAAISDRPHRAHRGHRCECAGELEAPEQMYRQLLIDQQRVLGDQDPNTLSTRHRLAWVVALQGQYGEAEQMYRQLLLREQQVLGDDHRDTLAARHWLASVVALQGRHAEAEQMYRQLLTDQQRVLGNDHPDTLPAVNSLARSRDLSLSLKRQTHVHAAFFPIRGANPSRRGRSAQQFPPVAGTPPYAHLIDQVVA
jgi:hypothetical protein